MSREASIAAQERLAQNVNQGDIDAAVQSFAEAAVDHDPAPGQGPGREGFRTYFAALRTAFSDVHIESAQMVADDDHVCIAYTLTGTHEGEFHSVAATQEDRGRRRSNRTLRGRSDRRALGQQRRARHPRAAGRQPDRRVK